MQTSHSLHKESLFEIPAFWINIFLTIFYCPCICFRNQCIYQNNSSFFHLQFKQMSHFRSLFLVSILLFAHASSQNTSPITYVEGCFTYSADNCCQSCEYGFTLTNGICTRSTNVTADCCSSYNSDGSCSQCAAGLYSLDPFCYRNQIYGCIRKSGNTCLACGAGFALQNGVCFTVITNCASYSAAGECTACNNGFSLLNSYCVPVPQIPNCAQGNFYGCLQCSNGFYLARNRTCIAFQPGCLQYYQEKCTTCLPAFTLLNGACVIDGCAILGTAGCSQCQNGYVLGQGKCFINNCAKVTNGVCILCQQGYRLSSNGCVQETSYSCKACQSGFVFVNNRCIQIIVGCVTYSASNTCSSCLANFQLTVNGLCQIIGCSVYSSSGCSNCSLPFILANDATCTIPNCATFGVNGCTNCSSGYYLKNGQCLTVDVNCVSYQIGACTQCKPKFHVVNGVCIQNERGCVYNSAGQCSCAGSFILSSSGKCIILGCSSYDSSDNCLACQSPFTFNSANGNCVIANCQTYTEACCKTCVAGYTLSNGVCITSDIYCVAYGSNGVCSTCQTGFTFNSALGKCIKNILYCASYSDQVTCQSCQTGYLLFGGQCVVPIPNCKTQSSATVCSACNNGFFLSQGTCSPNDVNCVSYIFQNGNQICSACVNGFQLLQGVCVKVRPGCVYTGTVCSSCNAPFVFDSSAASCYIPGCITYTSTGCQSCTCPFNLTNGNCVITGCVTYGRDSCTSCASGFTLSNGACVNQDINCLNFVNGQCTSCKKGFALLNGKCVVKDNNCDTYGPDGICIKCISTCYLDVKKVCQTKDYGCVYDGGKCKFCNPPFVLNQLANTCVIKNCLRTNSSGCTLCQNPFIIGNDNGCTLPNCNNVQDNVCVQCKSGFHIKNGAYCEADSPDCLSYDQDGNCQLCKTGLTLTSDAQCSALNSTCIQTCQSDKTKCLSCATGYFLNRYYQCQQKNGKCAEYTNGVCSQCADQYFLYSQICFPYTAGCVQYSGKDCTACRSGYTLKNGECFKWNQQNIGVIGANDVYNFSITPIDVRQSKYYINNLSPGSEIGKFFFSSFFDVNYQDCSLTTLGEITGKGWKAASADYSQFIGLTISDEPVTFYAIQLEAVEGSYITQFYLEYSVDGTNFVKVQNYFTVPTSVSVNMTTIYFTGIYAKAIRIKISKFQGWPACRIQFFYYDLLRFKKISNLKSLKYLQDTINSNFVDRVNNQIYINQAYFFNPNAACTSKEMCFTGLQLCQSRKINSVSLNFGAGGVVSEFYLTYTVDGRSYNCYNGCSKVTVTSGTNSTFTYNFDNLVAEGVRIYPTKYSGNPSFSPAFFYE